MIFIIHVMLDRYTQYIKQETIHVYNRIEYQHYFSASTAINLLICHSFLKKLYDYDYDMVLLRHTISTMYHGIIFKSCKKHNILQ